MRASQPADQQKLQALARSPPAPGSGVGLLALRQHLCWGWAAGLGLASTAQAGEASDPSGTCCWFWASQGASCELVPCQKQDSLPGLKARLKFRSPGAEGIATGCAQAGARGQAPVGASGR